MKFTKKIIALLAVLPLFALCVACGEDPTNNGDKPADEPGETPGGGNEQEQYEDITVVDGKVRFYLKEKADATRTATGMTARDWAKSSVLVGGKSYAVEMTDDATPRPYVEVPESSSYNATLITDASSKWYGASPYSDIKFPYSQFYHNAIANIKSFPMYASYSKETGNKLIFNDGFAMIYVRLKGTAKISSVKVENPAGKPIAGISTCSPAKGYFSIGKGVDFAVLNCTNNGDFVQLSTSKNSNFRIMVAAGTYADGLNISICDAEHLAMFVNTGAITLAAGDVHTIEMDYAPDADLCYYEGFDNFVWGGDVVKGSSSVGFAPTAETVTIESSAELTGYEDAFAEVAYNSPGTGFIQSNTWSEVNGFTVAQSHRLSDSYVASRNIADVNCLFRSQEHPGYIAIGAANTTRGIFVSPHAGGTKSIGRVKAIAKFALQAGFSGSLQVEAINGGVIESATLDGSPVDMTASNLSYDVNKALFAIPNNALPIPKSEAEKKEWHTLEMVINGATDGTRFYIADENSNSGVHGIYLNSVEIRQIEEWGKKDGTLRVLMWNLLCGMWCDQHNNYDNFVAWVKKYDPDVCIWCESKSLYPDNSANGSLSSSQQYLPNGWSALCTRYGHSYAAVGGNRDGFPQTVTSKYKISTVKKITDTNVSGKPVSHGAGHFTIEVNGKKLNIVALHMWPQKYGFGVSGTANQEASGAKKEGDYYREFEMQYIVDNTVNHANNAGEEYWILGGDTNSRSRLDAWYHKYADDDPCLLTHDVVRNQTNLKDVIGDYYPRNYFFSSTYASARIDILYASPKMFDRIENSIMLIDDWCYPRDNNNARDWYSPSDHRPVIVDFNMN